MNKLMINTLSLALLLTLTASSAMAEGWGTLKGRFVYDGKPPQLDKLIAPGLKINDPDVCKVTDQKDVSLQVNPANKGIGNVFVYLYSRRSPKIHESLEKPATPSVQLDNVACMFVPHAVFVRTDQKLNVINSDACGHNVHTFPLRNAGLNQMLQPNDKTGLMAAVPEKEILPIQIKCDIHPWMSAYALILDHPYAAVTDENGNFEIKMIPEGDHLFAVWQEKAGYIRKPSKRADNKLEVEITDGNTVDLGDILVDPALFADN